jgi:hypothetical protein
MGTASAVFGIYPTHEALESAIEALRAKGFRNTDISVLSAAHPAFGEVTAVERQTAAPVGGPSKASAVGATLGWLAGLGALAMAGGVFVVAGPVMAALASMGEAAGSIAGALAGFGVPTDAASDYEGRIVGGAMLLSIHTDDSEWFTRGAHILEESGALAITAVSEAPRPLLSEAQSSMHPMV